MTGSMSHRRPRFTIAQLGLLTMLSGLLCAWLGAAVERSQQETVLFSARLSADGKRLINFEEQHGFSVYDTQSGKCLIRRIVKSDRDFVFDENLTRVCVPEFENNKFAITRTHRVKVFEVAADSEWECETPPLDGWSWWPAGIDPDGLIVDVCGARVPQGDTLQPHLVRHWDLKSGKVVHQRLIEGENVMPMYFLPEGQMFLYGASNVEVPQAEIPILKDPADSRRDPNLPRHLPWFVEWRLNPNRAVRTAVPPRGSFLPEFICMNAKRNKALLAKTPSLNGQAEMGEHLFLADSESGAVRNLGLLPFQRIRSGQMTADEKWLYAIETNEFGDQSIVKLNLRTMDYERFPEPKRQTAGDHIRDLKLVNEDRQIALATINGTFRLLDAKTGKDVQPSKHLGFRRLGVMWYIFAGVGVAWVLLWWQSTSPKNGETADIGRYAGLMVFLVGLAIDLMLLLGRDEYRRVYYPLLYSALGCACGGAVVGLVLLFFRHCNKLAASFALAACAAMAGYIGYLLRTLT